MDAFREYMIDLEYEAESKQFLADLQRERQQQERWQETVCSLQHAVRTYRRKQRRLHMLKWLTVALLGLACGLAFMGLIDRLG